MGMSKKDFRFNIAQILKCSLLSTSKDKIKMEFNKISHKNQSSNSDFEEEDKRKNVDNFQYYLDLAKESKLSWDVLNNLMNDLCSSRTKSKRLNILLLKELKLLSESNSKL